MVAPSALIYRFAISQVREDKLDQIALLESTRTAATVAELATEYSADPATVYRNISKLTEVGFITNADEECYRATRAGLKASTAYQQVADGVGDEMLAYLAKSAYRRTLIREMETAAYTKAELTSGDASPARPTVHRKLEEFDDRGWLQRTEEGRFQVSEDASTCLEAYERLETAMQQAIEKEPCLRQLADWADPPLSVLKGTELVGETKDDPHALLEAAIDAAQLREDGLTRLRSIVPLFDPVSYELFADHINPNATFDVIFDQAAYQQLTRPSNIHYLATTLVAPSVNVRVYPEPLYTGLGIYNETVVLGGSTQHDRKAGVTGDSTDLYEWAMTTFDEMWEQSETPTGRLQRWVDESVPTLLPNPI